MVFDKITANLCGFLLAIFMGLNSVAGDQVGIKKTFRISVDPGALILGSIPLNFDMAIGDRTSLGLSTSGSFFTFNQKAIYYGGGLGANAKVYLISDAFTEGWYFKPAIHAEYLKIKFGWVNGKFFALSPSITFGYDWVWSNGFSIGLGLGTQFKHIFANASISREGDLDDLPFGMGGMIPTGEFTMGWTM